VEIFYYIKIGGLDRLVLFPCLWSHITAQSFGTVHICGAISQSVLS